MFKLKILVNRFAYLINDALIYISSFANSNKMTRLVVENNEF